MERIYKCLNDDLENFDTRKRRIARGLSFNKPGTLICGNHDIIKDEVKKWCDENKITFIHIDAKDINIIKIVSANLNGKKQILFKYLHNSNMCSIEELAKNYTKNSTFTSLQPLDLELKGVEAISYNNDELVSNYYVKREKLSISTFLDTEMSNEPFNISSELEELIKNKKCVILVSNLYTLPDDISEMITRKFISPEHKTCYDNSNIVSCIASYDRKTGERVPPFIMMHGCYVSVISLDDEN